METDNNIPQKPDPLDVKGIELKSTGSILGKITAPGRPYVVPIKKPNPHAFDINTVVYFIYLMYKINMLTRNHIKQMFAIIKDKTPGDIMKYLVSEAEQAA